MTARANPLLQILRRHGIEDADAFLEEKGKSAGVSASTDPDVVVRGNVQLMKNRMISRDEVNRRFEKLRFL